MLSKEELNEIFEYRDGVLFWKITKGSKIKKGVMAGSRKEVRYRQIHINGRLHMEHRLIWLMHNGVIPKGMQIDHINLIKTDNRIENLRLATPSQNMANMKLTANNTSTVKGVSFHKRTRKWVCSMRVRGSRVYKSFDSMDEAKNHYQQLATQVYGEFANLG